MKKVIIVDDEKMIRAGIRHAIPWESIGVDTVLLAANATQALTLIKKEQPEIMIADINMPDMTGLELIQSAREFMPRLRVIVITGYDHFDYVRDSLRLAVNDFFLKPVDEDALLEAIKNQLAALEQAAEDKENMLKLSTEVYKNVSIGIRRLLRNSDISQNLSLPEQFIEERARKIIILQITGREKEENSELEEYEITDICNSFLKFSEGEMAVAEGGGRIILLVNKPQQGEEMTVLLRQMKNMLVSEFGIRVQIILGKTVYKMEEIKDSYHDACELLKYCRSEDEDRLNRCRDAVRGKTEWEHFFGEFIQKLSETPMNVISLTEKYNSFIARAGEMDLSGDVAEICCFQIAAVLYYNQNSRHASFRKDRVSLEEFADMIQNCDAKDIFLLLKNYMNRLLCEEEAFTPDFITQAKLLINESLTEDISVNSIAARLYISPNYLSRMFKSVTGESCNNYIVRKRIEKAKELLAKTDIQSGKIAGMIGYKDSNYFSLAFKKSTGLSPQQYRQQHSGKEKQ